MLLAFSLLLPTPGIVAGKGVSKKTWNEGSLGFRAPLLCSLKGQLGWVVAEVRCQTWSHLWLSCGPWDNFLPVFICFLLSKLQGPLRYNPGLVFKALVLGVKSCLADSGSWEDSTLALRIWGRTANFFTWDQEWLARRFVWRNLFVLSMIMGNHCNNDNNKER